MNSSSNINEIIINDKNKFDYFKDKIKSLNFSQKSSYKLVVVTCYFNGISIKKLIKDVDQILKDVGIDLDEVELFLDKTELYYEYSLPHSNFNNFNRRITLKIPKSSQLFHPKAYCLMPANDINIEVAESALFFGSANLSEKGFGAANSSPNLELMYFTVDGTIISDFYRSLQRIETYDFKSLKDFAKMIEEKSTSEKEKNSLYKWRLIKEGNFVYRGNQGTIENNLAIKYDYQKDKSKTKDESKTVYYFWDNKADDSISPRNNPENAVVYFKQSNEYREILDIFLRHNQSYEVDWGDHGINILGNYYWLPKTLTDYLNLKDKFIDLKLEIIELFNNNEFFKTDLDSSAVKKMAGDLEADWNKLTATWKEKVFKKISNPDKKRLNIQSSQDLDECDKQQIAQILLEKTRTKFLKNLPEICKRYQLDNINLIQKIRPNNESENTALIDYVYERITKAKKNTRLGKHITEVVSSSTLKLEYIQLPHINRIDFLNEKQLGRLIEAHIRYWLRPWLTQEKQPIKNKTEKEGESIEIEIIQESKVFKLKILIPSKPEVVVMDQFKKTKENLLKNWKNLIFIFRPNKNNPFQPMKVYQVCQESNSVSEKSVPIPIKDEIFDYLFITLRDLIIK